MELTTLLHMAFCGWHNKSKLNARFISIKLVKFIGIMDSPRLSITRLFQKFTLT